MDPNIQILDQAVPTWCPQTLQAVADLYNISVEKLRRDLSRPQCKWIYTNNTSQYHKGEKCRSKVRDEGCVFCQRHHKTAKDTTNAIIIGNMVEKYYYFESIGVVQASMTSSTTATHLIQGDQEKFNSEAESFRIRNKIRDQTVIRTN